MRIGNNSGFDMMALMLKLQNNRNLRSNATTASANIQQAQTQRQNCLADAMGFTPPRSSEWERNHSGEGRLLSTGLSEEHLAFRQNWQDPVFRANLWLNGIDREGFEEPLGARVFTQLLHESGIELPENARFDISVDRYGGVTITGLDNEELTRTIESAMSYNWQMVVSVLAQFMEYGRILDGHSPSNTHVGLSAEQQDLLSVQSQLMNHGIGLHDLRLVNGIIQGLPQELHDIIYGDRSSHLEGLNSHQVKQENFRLNWLRDNTARFLRSGTEHIPAPNISLTFDNGRMIVNGVSAFNSGGSINVTI
ncbi:MAG: hypothetical protein FWF80_06100 [Defluviitaleaceae bacterium]|nr:hypothetical protein [Defluviitaleaceae bacterium]